MSAKDTTLLQVPSFSLPISGLISPLSQRLFLEQIELWRRIAADCTLPDHSAEAVKLFRDNLRKYLQEMVRWQTDIYSVEITSAEIGGVPVEIFTPQREVGGSILINVHGGGFVCGDREGGQVESIPIAGEAGLKVISVNYRMAPEHTHPAGAEDIIAVYRELLKTKPPSSIGIFGSSAGALLTSQVVSLLLARSLPKPAAIGMFAHGAFRPNSGDSARIFGAIENKFETGSHAGPYFVGVADTDATAFPAIDPQVLSAFPPTLLLSSGRDSALSSVIRTHSEMVANGVDATLHVWEGLRHGFYYDPRFPESRQAYRVAATFFRRRLV